MPNVTQILGRNSKSESPFLVSYNGIEEHFEFYALDFAQHFELFFRNGAACGLLASIDKGEWIPFPFGEERLRKLAVAL